MKELVKHEPGGSITPTPAETFIQQGIANNLSPEAMAELYKIWTSEKDRAAKIEFSKAFANFKRECPDIPKLGRNRQYTDAGTNQPSKYSTLADIMSTVLEPLADNGLSVSFGDVEKKGDDTTLECILSHSGGHEKTVKHPVVVESTDVTEKTKTNASQLLAIAVTYAKRYAVSNILALGGVDPDHDGNTPTGIAIEKTEVDRITKLLKESDADVARFLKTYNVKSVADMTINQYSQAVSQLERKKKKALQVDA